MKNRIKSITYVDILLLASLVLVCLGLLNVAAFIATAVLYGLNNFLTHRKGQVIDDAMKTLLNNQRIQEEELKKLKNKMTGISVKAGIEGGLTDLRTNMRRM